MFNMKMSPLIIVMICIVLGAFGQLSLKHGMNLLGSISFREMFFSKFFQIVFQPFVFTGLVLYAVSMFLWLIAISKLNLSLAYPLLSIGYILVAIFSFIFLKENISLLRWTGILLVVIGCFLILRR